MDEGGGVETGDTPTAGWLDWRQDISDTSIQIS